jgi:very-short-patch-repair endonuclease
MIRKNPNSSIRSGYKFEDLQVLRLCTEWLADPDKFKRIEIQYLPEGISGNGFAMDDIVVELNSGEYIFYQLKYKQNPETDLWTFGHLIEKGLSKWVSSYAKLNPFMGKKCMMLTNGACSVDVGECLNSSLLSFSAIRSRFPDEYDAILKECGDEKLLEDFFANFTFHFNEKNKDFLEEDLRDRLSTDLKVTKAGIDSLLLFIADQGSEKYPKSISLSEIRKYLSWDNPRSLNQRFEIPADFEFYNLKSHEELLNDLDSSDGGIRVIIGKPGAGKSTYLSKLYEILVTKGTPVVRHHYHLNPKDSSSRERLNFQRVKEAMRAEFKKEKKEVLGELASMNTEHVELRQFIGKIAAHYHRLNRTFVLVVDGLDHVIREGKDEEALREFLDEILYPHKGFWIVFGTQEIASHCFPNLVFDLCPAKEWKEIKGLGRKSVDHIVKGSFEDLSKNNYPAGYINKFFSSVFKLTGGNPLHLRYVISEIKNRGGNISAYDLEEIPPYKGDIKLYYEDLWRQLPDLSKTFCFAITSLDFKVQREQLSELASYFTDDPSKISAAFRSIKHLLRMDLRGVAVYHNSLAVFMLNQPELSEQKKLLYKKIRQWLTDSDQNDLKWSELAKIEYFLGNPAPLMKLDADWVVTSYLECRNEQQIENLLILAKEASFLSGNYEKNVYLNVLWANFANRYFNLSDNLAKIWVTSFRSRRELDIPYPDFYEHTHYQLKETLIALKERGRIKDIPEEAYERINDLLHESNDYEEIIRCWIEVLLHFSDGDDKRIFDFILKFRKDGSSDGYFEFYLSLLLEQPKRYRSRLKSLLNFKLDKSEKLKIVFLLISDDLTKAKTEWANWIDGVKFQDSPFYLLYKLLKGGEMNDKLSLSSHEDLPQKYNSYSSESIDAGKTYIKNFFKAFLLCAQGNEKEFIPWLNVKGNRWDVELMKVSIRVAQRLSLLFKHDQEIDIRELLGMLNKLPELDFFKDRDIYEITRMVLPKLIVEIIWLSKVINVNKGFAFEVSVDDVKYLLSFKWFKKHSIFDSLTSNKLKISDDAFQVFMDAELEMLKHEVTNFREKSGRMVNLALLAKGKKLDPAKKVLLRKAAENIIAYGHHKDPLLSDILESVAACGAAGSKRINEFLDAIFLYVYHIEALTDGDATGVLLYNYSGLLSDFNVSLLYNFYLSKIASRDYNDSELVFGDVLDTLDFKEKVPFALGMTIISSASISAVERLRLNDRHADVVLDKVFEHFGKIDYSSPGENNQEEKVREKKPLNAKMSKIRIGGLEKHLSEMDADVRILRYERPRKITDWFRYWIENSEDREEEVFNEAKRNIEEDLSFIDHELLDELYNHALSFDREFAFTSICWAQANSNGWAGDIISHLEDTTGRWDEVSHEFPERINEFFRFSIQNAGAKYGKTNKNYGLPLPRSVQFFIRTENLEEAENITSYYIEALKSQFPNMELPLPDFYANQKAISVFDILLTRLEWLSPIVRERAAFQIADLLIGDMDGSVHDLFFKYLNDIKLENIACQGLIILVKSLEHADSQTFVYLNSAKLGGLLSLRCMATDLLSMTVADRIGAKLRLEMDLILSSSESKPDISRDEFLKMVGHEIPRMYIDFFREIEDNNSKDIWKSWYHMYKDKCWELGLKQHYDDQRYANVAGEIMIGRCTIFGDILKSTFLNLIDAYYNMGRIDYIEFYNYTVKTFPIDISVWVLPTKGKPIWWPELSASPLEYESPLSYDLIDIEKMLKLDDGFDLIFLNGTISQKQEFYNSRNLCQLTIVPFLYNGDDLDNIDPERLYKKLISKQGEWHSVIEDTISINFFSNKLEHINGEQSFFMDKQQIFPIVSPIRPFVGTLWQYYRFFYQFNLFNPIFADELDLEISKDGLVYKLDGSTVAVISDFLDGIRDISKVNNALPAGKYIKIKSEILTKILEGKKLKLGYVIREKFMFNKEYERGERLKNKYVYKIRLAEI